MRRLLSEIPCLCLHPTQRTRMAEAKRAVGLEPHGAVKNHFWGHLSITSFLGSMQRTTARIIAKNANKCWEGGRVRATRPPQVNSNLALTIKQLIDSLINKDANGAPPLIGLNEFISYCVT